MTLSRRFQLESAAAGRSRLFLLWSSLITAAWNTSYHVRVLKSGSNEVRASWLTTRRLRVHAIILAICLWSSFVWIVSNPGLVGRNGVLKGADFLHF